MISWLFTNFSLSSSVEFSNINSCTVYTTTLASPTNTKYHFQAVLEPERRFIKPRVKQQFSISIIEVAGKI